MQHIKYYIYFHLPTIMQYAVFENLASHIVEKLFINLQETAFFVNVWHMIY